MMVLLIAVLDITENLQRFLIGGGLHLNLLESAFESAVLLDGVTVFIECRSTDALDGASSQGGLHDVSGIHAARGGACSDDGVDLVDEHDHVGVGLQLLHQGLQTLLKLSAVLCSCHHARHVEGVDMLAKEHRTRMMVGDELCQSFHDGTLTYTRLTDQDGVVLLPSAQDLNDTLDLFLSTYAGIELSVEGCLCQVGTEGVEHRGLRGRFLL